MPQEKQILSAKIGECIYTMRRRQKMTQEQLSEKADVSRNYLGLVERGEECPSVHLLYRIAKSLDMKLHELLSIADV